MTSSAGGDGFVSMWTKSGEHSLGSLQSWAREWNDTYMSEVSSNPRLGAHPAGPSALGHKMYNVKLAVFKAEKTAAVCNFLHLL